LKKKHDQVEVQDSANKKKRKNDPENVMLENNNCRNENIKTETKLEDQNGSKDDKEDSDEDTTPTNSENNGKKSTPSTPLFGQFSKSSNLPSFSSFLNAETKFPTFVTPSKSESKFPSSPTTPLFSFTPHSTSSIFANISTPESISPLKIALPATPTNTGEEEENTVHQVKTKLYVLTKGENNQYNYKERGVGSLKLNISKEGRARLVMRTDGAYRLILNIALFPTMDCQSIDQKSIRFVAMEDQVLHTFL